VIEDRWSARTVPSANLSLTLEHESASVVLLGNLNPAIFHPQWFCLHHLIDRETADAAQIVVVHPDIAIFRTDWFELQVDHERILLRALRPPHVQVFDLAIRLFREFLPHVPLRAAGINYTVHFRVPSAAVLMAVCNRVAPPAPWGDWNFENTGLLTGPVSLASLTMQQVKKDIPAGFVRTKVEPSARFPPGVFVDVNDHYEVTVEPPEGGGPLLSAIEDQFDNSMRRSKRIVDDVMKMAEES
jgi:hypothetical protein